MSLEAMIPPLEDGEETPRVTLLTVLSHKLLPHQGLALYLTVVCVCVTTLYAGFLGLHDALQNYVCY